MRPFPSRPVLLLVLAPLLAAPLVGGCAVVTTSDGFVVHGVRLEAKHVEELRIDSWAAEGLAVEARAGDVTVVRAQGPSEVLVTLHEVEPGDAWARYERGRIVTGTKSGKPCAVGDVVVRLGSTPPALHLATGLGDVDVAWLGATGETHLETGLGDVSVRDVERATRLSAKSGLGDVTVQRASCDVLEASTGLGDVSTEASAAQRASLQSGLGDIELAGCSFESYDAKTDLGDVRCRPAAAAAEADAPPAG